MIVARSVRNPNRVLRQPLAYAQFTLMNYWNGNDAAVVALPGLTYGTPRRVNLLGLLPGVQVVDRPGDL